MSSMRSWVVVVVASLFFCFVFAQIGMFNAITSQLMHDLNINSAEYGQLSAFYFYGNLLFLIPAGILLDRFSTKKLLLVVTLVSSVALCWFSQAENLWVAEFFRLVSGIAGAFAFLTILRLSTRWFSSDKLALVIGVAVTLAMLGGMLAQTPFVLMVEAYGWRQTLFSAGVFGFFIAILIALLVQDSPNNIKADISAVQSVSEVIDNVKLAIRNKQNWLGGLIICLLNLPIFVFGATWGNIYLQQVYHISAYQASWVISMVFVGMIVGSPLIGWFSDRYSFYFKGKIAFGLVKKKSRRQPLLISSILSLLLVSVLLLNPAISYSWLVVLFFMIGLVSSFQVCGYPLVAESNPEHLTASAGSISSMLIMAGGFVLPLFGWLVAYSGDGVMANGVMQYSLQDFNIALMILPISYILAGTCAYKVKDTVS